MPACSGVTANRSATSFPCCADCRAGHHDLDPDDWCTEFLWLLRRVCLCANCTFRVVRVYRPRYSQRHHQPHVCGRKRRTPPKHAA